MPCTHQEVRTKLCINNVEDRSSVLCQTHPLQLVKLQSHPRLRSKNLVQNQQSITSNQQLISSSSSIQKTSILYLETVATKCIVKAPKLSTSSTIRKRCASSNQFIRNGARKVNAGVYLVENVKSGHRYFGTTWDLSNASAQCFHDLQRGVHPHAALNTSFQLNSCAFRFRILEQVSPPLWHKPPSSMNQKRANQRRLKPFTRIYNSDGFDVRAMEQKLENRLRFQRQKIVNQVASMIVQLYVKNVRKQVLFYWLHAIDNDVVAECTAASVDVQRVVRGFLARLLVDKKRRDCAARKLQQFIRFSFRIIRTRSKACHLNPNASNVLKPSLNIFVIQHRAHSKMNELRQWLVAQKLKTYARNIVARRLVNCLRLMHRQNVAAIEIQCTIRGHIARVRVQKLRQQRSEFQAVTILQKMWRGFLTRTMFAEKNKVARRIQFAYIRWKARHVRELKRNATIIIQAYRNYVARKYVRFVILEQLMTLMVRHVVNHFEREEAALVIQCLSRRRQAQKMLYKIGKQKQCVQAIMRIQRVWRMHWTLLKSFEVVQTRKQEDAVRRIQAVYRSWLVRCEYLRNIISVKHTRVATLTQSRFKARQTRRKRLRRQKNQRLGVCASCRAHFTNVYHLKARIESCAVYCNANINFDDVNMAASYINVHRRLVKFVVSTQRRNRSSQHLKRIRFRACMFCERQAVRKSCLSCLSDHSTRDSAMRSMVYRPYDFSSDGENRCTRAGSEVDNNHHLLKSYVGKIIQCTLRMYLARCKLKRLKFERNSALKIQRVYRQHHSKLRYVAAVLIQSRAREYLGRRVAVGLKLERQKDNENAAACCIQCHLRGLIARRHILHIRQHTAVVRLQSFRRGYIARCELQMLQLENQRHFYDQLSEKLRFIAAKAADEEIAARRIQIFVRRRKARIECLSRRLEAVKCTRKLLQDCVAAREAVSASCIQRFMRQRIAITSFQRLRAHRCARRFLRRRMLNRIRLEKQSAVRIQRAFRYVYAKQRLTNMVDVGDTIKLQSKWVEYFDEASGHVYYYNTETCQSVWNRPEEMEMMLDDSNTDLYDEWVEYWDESVEASYFYNVRTGEATWTKPDEYSSPYHYTDESSRADAEYYT
ncbi:Spliceosomal protein FBP11/Splicing factor PRP40 [Plasmopara halstedii]|uniref:Spliceosomal protein FBP11/Splicing factor PRP40 n=1 Tax=Plasmopara halstedii TaxID=4781 RepID=A0A0P1AT07_PLAHL|nr:Spliceosomal protein FBP11/Splicing factor PRP40 [Plasmopara halstedii]CEG43896.1 Spliceosomal protein FBP11/Splicing factor PRP40 [Plasmopara halstedii]|eukprot:XP_024580265.1 Spliceosomal protein FBP11/Splicing factor PRP40 [Plasmopara halstedii]